jgi:hypothetical protein
MVNIFENNFEPSGFFNRFETLEFKSSRFLRVVLKLKWFWN